jgi:hypothetical protein
VLSCVVARGVAALVDVVVACVIVVNVGKARPWPVGRNGWQAEAFLWRENCVSQSRRNHVHLMASPVVVRMADHAREMENRTTGTSPIGMP